MPFEVLSACSSDHAGKDNFGAACTVSLLVAQIKVTCILIKLRHGEKRFMLHQKAYKQLPGSTAQAVLSKQRMACRQGSMPCSKASSVDLAVLTYLVGIAMHACMHACLTVAFNFMV